MKYSKPGQIAIVLAGKYKGKRVVCLRNLRGGLILVTGPYCVNRVPLRRMNRSYMILTHTRVNIANVDLKGVKMSLFRRKKIDTKAKKNAQFVNKKTKKPIIRRSKELIELQKKIDKQIVANISKRRRLKAYLRAHFTLTNGQRPHMMKF